MSQFPVQSATIDKEGNKKRGPKAALFVFCGACAARSTPSLRSVAQGKLRTESRAAIPSDSRGISNVSNQWGLPLSNQCFFNESSDPANLTNSQRGHLAELAFMRKAASLGLSVAKPWNEGERYDFIVRVETVCWRVQVKSVLAKSPTRHHYRVQIAKHTRKGTHVPYSAAEIDFLVAYMFSGDLWYVFPAARIAGKKSICVSPGSKRSPFEQYREAWKLMKPRPANADAKSAAEPAAHVPETESQRAAESPIHVPDADSQRAAEPAAQSAPKLMPEP